MAGLKTEKYEDYYVTFSIRYRVKAKDEWMAEELGCIDLDQDLENGMPSTNFNITVKKIQGIVS